MISARRQSSGSPLITVIDHQMKAWLCNLSGAGFRAMLFHVGSLHRLNDLGLLPRLNRVSSVSGGSITAAVLGQAWPSLDIDRAGVSQRFDQAVLRPIHLLASTTIDLGAIVHTIAGAGAAGRALANAYRPHLFGNRTLQDFPGEDGPRFVINASILQSGALWRFSQPYVADYRVGSIPHTRLALASAVAASSGIDLQQLPFTTRVYVPDGGVYDNLGFETAWKRYATILVSDAGGHMSTEPKPRTDWLRHTGRVLDLVDNQVPSLRKRQLINSFKAPPSNTSHRSGTYWGIHTDITDYPLADPLDCPHSAIMRLAQIPTHLAAIDGTTQEQIINWGYAVCNAAIRAHIHPVFRGPRGFPSPGRESVRHEPTIDHRCPVIKQSSRGDRCRQSRADAAISIRLRVVCGFSCRGGGGTQFDSGVVPGPEERQINQRPRHKYDTDRWVGQLLPAWSNGDWPGIQQSYGWRCDWRWNDCQEPGGFWKSLRTRRSMPGISQVHTLLVVINPQPMTQVAAEAHSMDSVQHQFGVWGAPTRSQPRKRTCKPSMCANPRRACRRLPRAVAP
jgi:NTE family protein